MRGRGVLAPCRRLGTTSLAMSSKPDMAVGYEHDTSETDGRRPVVITLNSRQDDKAERPILVMKKWLFETTKEIPKSLAGIHGYSPIEGVQLADILNTVVKGDLASNMVFEVYWFEFEDR